MMTEIDSDGFILIDGKIATQPEWEYKDNLGIIHTGYMDSYADLGGSDVTYMMRDGVNGKVSVISGNLIKYMKPTHKTIRMTTQNCPVKEVI